MRFDIRNEATDGSDGFAAMMLQNLSYYFGAESDGESFDF